MKLKCDTHNRRVLSGTTSWLHRTGDKSPCNSKTATIGDEKIDITQAGIVLADVPLVRR